MAEEILKAVFRKAVKGAMQDLADQLSGRFREEIESTEWDYPTPPRIRDIVDTGRLRDSQVTTVSTEGDITIRWTAPYAAQVHEGGVTTEGERFPGRPWTRDPIAELPQLFGRGMETHLRRELGNAQP